MNWVSYGPLSCFQSFRAADTNEAFDQAFDLFERSLQNIGFDYVQPGHIQTSTANPHGCGIAFVRAAWRRASSSDEDVVAVGLQLDDPRFDYVASVRGTDLARANNTMAELRQIDVGVRRQLRALVSRRSKIEMGDRHAKRLKAMLTMSPAAAGGVYVLLSGTVANYLESGLASSTKGLLFWVPYAAAGFGALYAGLAFFYLMSLGWADVRERLWRH